MAEEVDTGTTTPLGNKTLKGVLKCEKAPLSSAFGRANTMIFDKGQGSMPEVSQSAVTPSHLARLAKPSQQPTCDASEKAPDLGLEDHVAAIWGLTDEQQAQLLEFNLADAPFTSLAGGVAASCVMNGEGAIRCVGEADNTPAFTETKQGFRDLAMVGVRACGLRDDNSIQCFYGSEPYELPAPLGAMPQQLMMTLERLCMLRADGDVSCLSHPSSTAAAVAEVAEEATQTHFKIAGPFTKVLSTDWQICGLRQDGSVACWGAPSRDTRP